MKKIDFFLCYFVKNKDNTYTLTLRLKQEFVTLTLKNDPIYFGSSELKTLSGKRLPLDKYRALINLKFIQSKNNIVLNDDTIENVYLT